MFKDVRSLKAFIAYCKKESITKVKVGDIELEFAALPTTTPNIETELELKEPTPEELKQEELEDLMWSSGHNRI